MSLEKYRLGYKATFDGLANLARRRWKILVATNLLLTFVYLVSIWDSSAEFISTATSFEPLSAAHLHLLIPANKRDENLCKTVISAAITGWPTPTLLNWGATFDDKKLVAGGSHIAKISGVLEYLENLGPEHDKDLVLLVDGYDIWFQLRPSTVIARYNAINQEANARVRKSMGSRVVEAEGIEQTIVFSAQKRCWPWKDDDAPCAAVPESSLPADIYGPETDRDISLARKVFQKNPYLKSRQRYLNSGNAMGRVDALRTLFKRAMQEAEKDKNFGSDQKIFAGIFGDQEVQRGLMRNRHRSLRPRWMNFWKDSNKSQLKEGRPDEFGIGLDYESFLGMPTVFCEEDAAWIVHDDPEGVNRWSKELETPPSRVGPVSADIAISQPPFRVAAPLPGSNLPIEKPWSKVPLFTNMWTGIVPGLIHHNAHRDGLKSRRRTWWNETWFHEYARPLYESQTAGPVGPVAVIVGDGTEVAWWSSTSDKGGAKSDAGDWVDWNEMCADFEEEIFRGRQ